MKKYIKSSYTYDPWKGADLSEWSAGDIEIWNATDWKARNYDSLLLPEDSFEDYLDIYGVPTEDGDYAAHEIVKFVKELRANTIYSPIFTVSDEDWDRIFNKYKNMGYSLVTPMYDGTTVEKDGVTYKVADRAETYELYDRLSR